MKDIKEAKQFSKAILEAQKLLEESWNKEIAEYGLDSYQSAQQACINLDINAGFVYPIHLLNSEAWNDIQHWAETIIKDGEDSGYVKIISDIK